MNRRSFSRALAAACAVSVIPRASQAADAMRILVGFSAGSPSDLLARALADKLAVNRKAPVVVENRPGAGGLLAVRALLAAPADGNTLLVVSAAHAATPVITRNLDFDPVRDIAGISRIALVPSVLVTSVSSGLRSVKALITQMQAEPNKLNYSTPGRGSANHFAAAYLLAQNRSRATDVPFRGVPEALTAVMSGDCQFSFVPLPNALPAIQSGKVNALALSTKSRVRLLPDVPTVAESGFPSYVFDPWFGLLASAKVPINERNQIISATQDALASADMKARFDAVGAQISPLPVYRE
jgi:tripartite-type tricarboxylate transporter receptor subunit TctC